MKRLTLLRHAQAAEAEPGQGDHDRKLTANGVTAAAAIGNAPDAAVPDLVLCSPSLRTRETLAAIAASWPTMPETRFAAKLYLASDLTLLECIRAAPATSRDLWVIGHNPGLHQLALRLGGAELARREPELARKFPTAARAVFELPDPAWTEIGTRPLRLAAYLRA